MSVAAISMIEIINANKLCEGTWRERGEHGKTGYACEVLSRLPPPQGRFYTGAYGGRGPCKHVPGPYCGPPELTEFFFFTRFSFSCSLHEMRKGHCSLFFTVNKKVRETYQGIERAEELEEGEPEPFV